MALISAPSRGVGSEEGPVNWELPTRVSGFTADYSAELEFSQLRHRRDRLPHRILYEGESGSSLSAGKASLAHEKITKSTGNTQILLNNDNSQVTNPLETKSSNNYNNFSISFPRPKLIQSGTKKYYSILSAVSGTNQLDFETDSSKSFNQ